MREAGLEPARSCLRGCLRPLRLPFRHSRAGPLGPSRAVVAAAGAPVSPARARLTGHRIATPLASGGDLQLHRPLRLSRRQRGHPHRRRLRRHRPRSAAPRIRPHTPGGEAAITETTPPGGSPRPPDLLCDLCASVISVLNTQRTCRTGPARAPRAALPMDPPPSHLPGSSCRPAAWNFNTEITETQRSQRRSGGTPTIPDPDESIHCVFAARIRPPKPRDQTTQRRIPSFSITVLKFSSNPTGQPLNRKYVNNCAA